jgi:TP901 family phage tail tape measure protein
MARIELNVVALGDFSSVNTQIKNLQTQVALLQKGLAGVGVNTALAKDLNSLSASFKQTMLSSGQFTEQTIKMQTETAKFGQALEAGKLKLTDYYSIIRQRSSEAVTQMKALAVEQTKLQNSIVISDPTKQGLLSIYTPTQIDKVSQATKIATNEANLYAIAVNKGSQALTNWGKNTQWAGRQLTVGLTVPMAMFGSQAVKVFNDVNTELVRLQKVYGTGLTQPSQAALDAIKKQTIGLATELAQTMGVSAKDTAAMAADLAATGKTGVDLLTSTREAMRLSKLGELDTQSAMKATISLQNVYKLSTQQLSGAVDFLNAVENQTSTSLQDLVDGIPRVGPIVQQLGGSFKDTAVMMVAMKEAGVPAAQSANAIKSAIASLINPTKAAKDAFAAYNINLASIATNEKGNPVKMIMDLQAALKGLAPLAQAQLIEKLFGKFQEARIQALIGNLGAANSQTKTAFDLMNANSQQLANVAAGEMKTATESVTGKYQRAMETFKSSLIPIGEKIMEVGTKLLDFGNKVAKIFNSLPGPLKSFMGALALGVALAGPIIMLTGLIANFAGYLLKGFFNLKQLATGGKTLGQMLTPELIAAQNASQIFNENILSNVSSVDLLEKAIKDLTIGIEGMVSALNVGTGVAPAVAKAISGYEQMKLPGFASGLVPGSGPSNVDSFPAMLAPGEAVIDAETTKSNLPLIKAMVGRSKKGIQAFQEMYLGPTSGNKKYSAPGPIQGGASMLAAASNYPEIVKITDQVIKEYGLLDSYKTDKEKTDAYKQFTQYDLAHREKPGIINGAKSWVTKMLYGTTHPENQLLEQIASPTHDMGKKADKTIQSLFDNITETGFSKQQIEEAVGNIKLAKQPITDVEQYVYLQILKDIKKEVDSMPPAERTQAVQSKSVKNALLAEATMSARASGQIGPIRSLADFTKTDLTNFNREKEKLNKAANEAGVAFDEGFISGVKSGIPQAERVQTAFVNANIVAVEKAAQIHSPSLIMQKLGRMFGLGWITGINSMGAEAKAAGANLATQAELGAQETMGAETSGGMMSTLLGGKLGGKIFKGGLAKGSGVGMFGMMAGAMITPQLGKVPGVGKELSTAGSWAAMASMTMNPYVIGAAAAAGLAVGGIQHLMAIEKEQEKQAKATWTSSADAAKFFGGTVQDTTNHMGDFNVVFDKTSVAVAGVNSQIAAVNPQLKQFNDMIKSLPTDNPLKTILENMKQHKADAAGIAKSFVDLQVAIGNVDASKAQQLINLMLASSGNTSQIGKVSAAGDIKKSAQAAMEAAQKAGQGTGLWDHMWNDILTLGIGEITRASAKNRNITNAVDSVMNQAMEAAINSKSLKQIQDVVSGFEAAGLKGKKGIDAFARSLHDSTEAQQVQTLHAMGLDLKQIAEIFAYLATGNSIDFSKGISKEDMKKIEDFLKNYKSPIDAANASLNKQNTILQSGVDSTNSQIKALEAKKKVIDRELKAQQDATAELQRQEQYLLKQGDLANKIREARAGGNYLQSAMLQQEMFSNQADFANQGATNLLQQQSDVLGQKIADLQDKVSNLQGSIDKNTKAVEDNTANKGTDTGSKKKAELKLPSNTTSSPNYQPVNPKDANATGPTGYKDANTGKTLTPEQARTVPTSTDKEYLNPKVKPGQVIDLPDPLGGVDKKYTGKDAIGNYYDGNGNVTSSNGTYLGRWYGFPVGENQGKVIAYKAMGGMIFGPGTSTSDSIMAMLSHGEYVMNASSVSKYGPSFMNAINNKTFNPSFPNMGQSSVNVSPSGTMGSTYNITVNAETNADANQIAQAVMDTIKRQTAMTQTVRSVRV